MKIFVNVLVTVLGAGNISVNGTQMVPALWVLHFSVKIRNFMLFLNLDLLIGSSFVNCIFIVIIILQCGSIGSGDSPASPIPFVCP